MTLLKLGVASISTVSTLYLSLKQKTLLMSKSKSDQKRMDKRQTTPIVLITLIILISSFAYAETAKPAQSQSLVDRVTTFTGTQLGQFLLVEGSGQEVDLTGMDQNKIRSALKTSYAVEDINIKGYEGKLSIKDGVLTTGSGTETYSISLQDKPGVRLRIDPDGSIIVIGNLDSDKMTEQDNFRFSGDYHLADGTVVAVSNAYFREKMIFVQPGQAVEIASQTIKNNGEGELPVIITGTQFSKEELRSMPEGVYVYPGSINKKGSEIYSALVGFKGVGDFDISLTEGNGFSIGGINNPQDIGYINVGFPGLPRWEGYSPTQKKEFLENLNAYLADKGFMFKDITFGRSSETKKLQAFLEAEGFSPGKVDSSFGPSTYNALRRFFSTKVELEGAFDFKIENSMQRQGGEWLLGNDVETLPHPVLIKAATFDKDGTPVETEIYLDNEDDENLYSRLEGLMRYSIGKTSSTGLRWVKQRFSTTEERDAYIANLVSAVQANSNDPEMARKIIESIKKYGGYRYTWEHFDCSWWTRETIGKDENGRYIVPRFSVTQGLKGERVYTSGRDDYDTDSWKTGDIVYFNVKIRRKDGTIGYPNHVGMYIGNGLVIHNSGGCKGLCITDLNGDSSYSRLLDRSVVRVSRYKK